MNIEELESQTDRLTLISIDLSAAMYRLIQAYSLLRKRKANLKPKPNRTRKKQRLTLLQRRAKRQKK